MWGWDLALLGLALHLVARTEQPVDEAVFAQSEDAQQFIRSASQYWGRASVNVGTPEAEASAAAQRTAAFYLGESSD